MDYLPTLGEKWLHSRGNGLVNIPYMEHLGKALFLLGALVDKNPNSKIAESSEES